MFPEQSGVVGAENFELFDCSGSASWFPVIFSRDDVAVWPRLMEVSTHPDGHGLPGIFPLASDLCSVREP